MAASLALNAQEKRVVKDAIDPSANRIIAAAFGETYYSLPGSDIWSKQYHGGLAFVYHKEKQSFSLVMVDLKDGCTIWEHEIDETVELRRHSQQFVSFSAYDLFLIGLSLSDEAEATRMIKKITKRKEIQAVEVTLSHVIQDLTQHGIGKKTLKREKAFIRKFIKTACKDGLEKATEKFEVANGEKTRSSSRSETRAQTLNPKASFTIKRPLPPLPPPSPQLTPVQKAAGIDADRSRSVRFSVVVNNTFHPRTTMDAERRKSLVEAAKAKGPPPPPPVRRSTA